MPCARLHPGDEPQDLALDGDVERGGRLVGDDERAARRRRRRRSGRAGASRPRARADRQRSTRSGSGTCTSSRSSRARASARPAVPAEDVDQPVGDLRADPARRVERGQRVLRDQRAGRADQAAALGWAGRARRSVPSEAGSGRPRSRPRGAGCRGSALPIIDLPAPDSPTRPRASPAATSSDTPRSRRLPVRRVSAERERFRTAQEAHRSTGSKRSFKPLAELARRRAR